MRCLQAAQTAAVPASDAAKTARPAADSGSETGPDAAPGLGPKPDEKFELTRERLLDGSVADHFRANAPPGYHVRSQAELDESLDEALADHPADQDVWVFGYGSLMWNPAFEHDRVEKSHVFGWSRRFCIKLLMGRGSTDCPGVMLGLDRGGSCWGLSLRIPAAKARQELSLLWRREMLSSVYQARWVGASIHGRRQQALTFVVNRLSPRYLGALPLEEQAHMLNTGVGRLGTCREYFDNTMASLKQLEIRDAGLQRLARVMKHTG